MITSYKINHKNNNSWLKDKNGVVIILLKKQHARHYVYINTMYFFLSFQNVTEERMVMYVMNHVDTVVI